MRHGKAQVRARSGRWAQPGELGGDSGGTEGGARWTCGSGRLQAAGFASGGRGDLEDSTHPKQGVTIGTTLDTL